ncbi:MAG TPA: GNAT family N-acetyltransferase, partial [Rubricoccaceae bacterium]|nr:GNAT family N-acetyltransferase [Rubricoccaceae bacterium]
MAEPVLETDRLRMTPLSSEEAGDLHALWTQPEVRRYLWDDQVLAPEQTAAILRENEALFAREGFGLWALREKDAPALVGFGGYWHFREPPERELILGLAPAHWYRGLATEAGRALIRHAFEGLGFDEVRGSADAANTPSIRLMERLGMHAERRAAVGGLDTHFARLARADWRPPYTFRFAFDEVVRVVSDDPTLAEVNGERAVVVGRGDPAFPPGYAVFVYRAGRVWCVEEHEIEPTGETDPRLPPTHAIRVRVDAQGRGEAVGVRRLDDPED